MSDLVNIKDASGATVPVLTDEVVHPTFGTGQAQLIKILSADPGDVTGYGQTNPFPIQGKQSALQTGTITTAISTIAITTAAGYNLATVGVSGTYAGVSFVFEGSLDNTNWFPLQAQQTDTGAVATSVLLLTNTARAWDVFIGAWSQFRVRATAWTSGTATIQIALQSMPTEPVPTVIQQRDPARTDVHYYTLIPVATSATDTLLSLTGTKAGAAVGATTTPAVVSTGKTLFVQRFAATYVATATSGYAVVRLRHNTSGTVVIGSPVAATVAIGAGTPGTANSVGTTEASLGDGRFFAAGTGIGISAQGFAATTATAVGFIFVSIVGFEF